MRKWLGLSETGDELKGETARGTIKGFCCEEADKEGTAHGYAKNMLDGSKTTYWHSRWSSDKEAGPHWFEYKLSSADSKRKLKGFRYVARPNTNGYANGKPLTLTIEMYDTSGKLLQQETAKLSESVSELNQWTEKDYVFSKSVKNVSYIKVVFTDCYNNEEQIQNTLQNMRPVRSFSTLYTNNDDDTETNTELILRI